MAFNATVAQNLNVLMLGELRKAGYSCCYNTSKTEAVSFKGAFTAVDNDPQVDAILV
jgi:hypothetical protein